MNSRHTLAFFILSTLAYAGCSGALRGGTIGQDHPQPAPQYRAVGLVVLDPLARPIVNASCGLAGATDQGRVSNADGYILFATVSTTLRATQLTCAADGFLPFSEHRDLTTSANEDLAPAVLTPARKPRPTRDQVLNIRANFIGPHDSHGRVIFDPYYISLPDDERAEWRAIKHAAGVTHVVLCPVASYPNYPAPYRYLLDQPNVFAVYVRELLDDGFVPIIFLTTGDGGSQNDLAQYAPSIITALKAEEPYLWYVPGFEWIGPGGCCLSSDYAAAADLIRRLAPLAALGAHFQPERATGSSHPIEPDDPWQGAEPDFWRSHGGELFDALLYQAPHGLKLLVGNEWEDRWVEILDRLGVGGRGWRRVSVSFFETIGYDLIHGHATDADATRVATRAQQLCAARGVACTFGNGLPR